MSPHAEGTLIERVTALYFDYAAAVDDVDMETLRSLLTEDVTFESNRRISAVIVGADALLKAYAPLLAQPGTVSRHLVSNVRVLRVDGDLIHTHAYFTATFHFEDTTSVQTGCYRDVHVQTAEGLRIRHKRVEVDPAIIHPRPTA
ncbi:nuclear transport factor 2 family protein [Microbacterium sp. NPDC055442]